MRTLLILTFVFFPLPAAAQTLHVSFAPTAQGATQVPTWARVAFFDADRVASTSAAGKSATATLDALRKKRESEAQERSKTLQAERQKLASALLSDAARVELTKKVERFEIDLQRFLEDARAELAAAQQQLASEFRRKLGPAVERVAKDRGLDLVFIRAESGLFWANPAFDVSEDVAKQIDRTNEPE